MPVTYGNTAFDDARDAVGDQLDALMANMVTNSIAPKFDAVYREHWETPAPDFYCVSISLSEVNDMTFSAQRIEYLYQVELRILTGNDNQPFDEVTFLRLANSVLNWFRTNTGGSDGLGNNFRMKIGAPSSVEANVVFPDIRAVGGLVKFTIFGVETYTPV